MTGQPLKAWRIWVEAEQPDGTFAEVVEDVQSVVHEPPYGDGILGNIPGFREPARIRIKGQLVGDLLALENTFRLMNASDGEPPEPPFEFTARGFTYSGVCALGDPVMVEIYGWAPMPDSWWSAREAEQQKRVDEIRRVERTLGHRIKRLGYRMKRGAARFFYRIGNWISGD